MSEIKSKKILLVSSGFYPEISPRSYRATELAKELTRQGHSVVVISKYRNHDYSAFLKENDIKLKMWGKARFPKVLVFKRKPFSIISRGLSRLLMVLFEYPGIEEMFRVKGSLRDESGYDLMISFAVPYPVHWGVARSRSEKHQIADIWIADCGDPYMLNRLDRFRKPFYFKYAEKDFCRKCDFITLPVEGMQNKFYPEFMMKIRIIPQGIDFREVRLYNGAVYNEIPVIIFAGSVIPGKRDLSSLLDYMSSLKVNFKFIIYTSQVDWYGRYKQILGEKLEIRSYIDRLSLIYEMSKVSFLVNIDTVYDKGAMVEAVPSKLIDYALSGRPILNLVSGSIDKDMVQEFLKGDYSRRRLVDKSSYDIRKVSLKFLDLIYQ